MMRVSAGLWLMAGCVAAGAQATPASVLGSWRIERVIARSRTACWDEARAQTLVGTTLTYAPHRVTFAGGSEAVSETLTRTVSAAQFRQDSRMTLAEIGLRVSTVTELDLQHEDADFTGGSTEVPGDTVLLAGTGKIVVSACGVYYSAVRIRR